MSWLSFTIVALLCFVPPLGLSERLYRYADALFMSPPLSQHSLPIPEPIAVFLILIGVWLLTWLVLWFGAMTLLGGHFDIWISHVAQTHYPTLALRLFPAMCMLTMLLAFGGLHVINLALGTSFMLPSNALMLALFGLVAETGRYVELAVRDERKWRRRRSTIQRQQS